MRYIVFLPFILCLACHQKTYSQQTLRSLPSLTVQSDSVKTALEISKLDIQISITGNIASTVYDITFYNPFDRVLEGSFEFPLAEGQSVYRYGLDIDGVLREGVVVEKQEARVAYENTIRRKIDPGLVEKTVGNNYRTRVYPIPAKGYKHLLIGVEQAMVYSNDRLVYHLPLNSDTEIGSMNIHATVHNSDRPVAETNTPEAFSFSWQQHEWIAGYAKTNFIPDIEIKFAIPFSQQTGVLENIGKHKNETYFYLALPLKQEYVDRKKPATVTLLWDVSGSVASRNIERELGLLERYFKHIRNTMVRLIPFRNIAGAAETFAVKDGDCRGLTDRLCAFEYDGATQLGDIDLSADPSDQVLLFTDGISNFGKKELVTGKAPIAVISSSVMADYNNMNFLTLQTHGVFINLNQLTDEDALQNLVQSPLQFIGADYNKDEIDEVDGATNIINGFALAGKLKSRQASVVMHFGYGTTVIKTVTHIVTASGEAVASVPRSWATLKLARLEMQPAKNNDAITETGKEFSVVTPNTSLLVLDRLEDYLQYKITPPAELRQEYDSLIALRASEELEEDEGEDPLETSVEVMDDLKLWYNKRIHHSQPVASTGVRYSPPTTVDTAIAPIVMNYNVSDSSVNREEQNLARRTDRVFLSAGDTSPVTLNVTLQQATAMVDEVVVTCQSLEGRVSGVQVSANRPVMRGMNSISGNASPLVVVNGVPFEGSLSDIPREKIKSMVTLAATDATGIYGSQASNGAIIITTNDMNELQPDTADVPPVPAGIEISGWQADAGYLLEIEKAGAAEYYRVYQQLKLKYGRLPAFYADIADFLYRHGKKELAVQVLSNLAEIGSEDAESLRILGHRLQEWDERELAIQTFRDVVRIRAEHPQSHRDLALALADAGHYQEAADGLYQILTHSYDERFEEMTEVVLMEFNAIISMHPELNTAAWDKRLIYAMPLDIRVVISWSSDNSDIDLWVTDPLKEKCMYSNPKTKAGGKLSGDITEGFGPEDFCIKKAVTGEYVVEINYYGDRRQTILTPITVTATMYTHYGTAKQKKEEITVRLGSEQEVVKLGVLRF